jgi:23S rRNA (cytidine1920-2'-O)/16S rRNA (cytidine1409-2'-O)-methyltransferase
MGREETPFPRSNVHPRGGAPPDTIRRYKRERIKRVATNSTGGQRRREVLRSVAKRSAHSVLRQVVAELYPELSEPEESIRAGGVLVDGFPVRNPASVVGPHSRITLRQPILLRGEAKLKAALATFAVSIAGRIALDAGASAGGFTKVLLEHGARRVYAVDAGYGQLLGSLRQHADVVNLERINLGELDRTMIADTVEIVTLDLSFLSLADAVPQLNRIAIGPGADLIALVKPMFELHLAQPPTDMEQLQEAVMRAREGIERAGWQVLGSMDSPIRGARGAVEFLIHARSTE